MRHYEDERKTETEKKKEKHTHTHTNYQPGDMSVKDTDRTTESIVDHMQRNLEQNTLWARTHCSSAEERTDGSYVYCGRPVVLNQYCAECDQIFSDRPGSEKPVK